MQREYHEIYGFLPEDVINQIDPRDRQKLFFEWLQKRPSLSGWFIVTAVVKALGEPFADYLFKIVGESLSLNEQDVTKETVRVCMEDLMTNFATDVNTLHQFIDNYLEETGNDLPFDFSLTGQEDSDSDEEKNEVHRDSKGRLRDAKGHFVKEEK